MIIINFLNLEEYLQLTLEDIGKKRLKMEEFFKNFLVKIDKPTSFFDRVDFEQRDLNSRNLTRVEKWIFLCSPSCFEGLINLLKKSNKLSSEKSSSFMKTAKDLSEWVYIKEKHYFKEAIIISRLWNNYNSSSLDEFFFLKSTLELWIKKEKQNSNYESEIRKNFLFFPKGREREEEREKSIKECLKILKLQGYFSKSDLKKLIKEYSNELEKIFWEYEEIYNFLNRRKAENFWEDKEEEQIENFLDYWSSVKNSVKELSDWGKKRGIEKIGKDKPERNAYDPILFPNNTYKLCITDSNNVLKQDYLSNSSPTLNIQKSNYELRDLLLLTGLIFLIFFLLGLLLTLLFKKHFFTLSCFPQKNDKHKLKKKY